jgi:hypothetical protein
VKHSQDFRSRHLGRVEYDPGDALGFPVEMTFEEALSCWKHDTAYLQTLLDCTVVSHVKRWPTIRYEGREVPNSQICQLAAAGP